MATSHRIELQHQGQTIVVDVPEDQTILSVAQNNGVDLPASCTAGVCTTCAAKMIEGTVERVDDLGISPELQEQGFVLLCVSYPRSDCKILTEQEDTVYHLQFGQYQQKK